MTAASPPPRRARLLNSKELSDRIADIARTALGPENANLSTPDQLRFGSNGSVAVEIGSDKVGTYYNFECRRGGGPLQFLMFEAGLTKEQVPDWLRDHLGIELERRRSLSDRIIATYDYHDEQGNLLYWVVRLADPKDFRQRAADGKWSTKGIRKVLYHLPDLIAADPAPIVWIAEGEKSVDQLRQLGLVATCSPGGAGKWRREYAQYLAGRWVAVLPDNDDAGREHAETVAASLAGVAAGVRIVELPDLSPKGDVFDWLEAGGTAEGLYQLAMGAPDYQPKLSTVAPTKSGADAVEIIDPSAPYEVAKRYRDLHFSDNGIPTLHRHRGSFYAWSGSAYIESAEDKNRAGLYAYLNRCMRMDPEGQLQPVKPNIAMVSNVADGLRAAAHLDDQMTPPAWLDQAPDLPADEILSCANGLLHLPTLQLMPHTPLFFTHNALPFNFERKAPEPREWIKFLKQLWDTDLASTETLQEIFGLALTGDTSHQKGFLIIGPKRSGKGTFARVLTQLLGANNVVAPTLAGLGTQFGLEPLIGKRVAIISDARLGGRADQHTIAERLLSITGEDAITVDRKFKSGWTGKLQVRFVILSNELPRLTDASGAFASRLIVLSLTESFYGREDRGLTDRLLAELPGILNWAIEGWQRLNQRGYFQQPESAAGAVRDLEDLGSPIGAFIRECCNLGAGFTADPDELFSQWGSWCNRQGRKEHGTKQTFGRDLRAAMPAITMSRPRTGSGKRERQYEGIGIRPLPEPPRFVIDFNRGSGPMLPLGPQWSAVPTIARVGDEIGEQWWNR